MEQTVPCSFYWRGERTVTKGKNYSGSLEMKLIPYLFIAPNFLIFLLFITVPAIFGIYYSMTNWHGVGGAVFTGLKNYVDAFNDTKFWMSVCRTSIYVVVTMPFIMIISILLAILMVQEIHGRGFFRSAYYWPSMISYIVVGISFKFIFGDNTGVVNYFFSLIGLHKIDWLTEGITAMIVVIIATIWSRAGFYMVIYITGLQSISPSLYEAAKVDGATGMQQFMKITLPLLKPTNFLVLVLGMIDLFKNYGLVISLTNGGPISATKFVVQFIYDKAYSEMNMGYSCTLSMILFVIIAGLTLVQYKLGNGGRGDA